jgi:hypothetical protein
MSPRRETNKASGNLDSLSTAFLRGADPGREAFLVIGHPLAVGACSRDTARRRDDQRSNYCR